MSKILYFTDDFSLDNQEFAKSNGLTIRKASTNDGGFVEKCHAVYAKDKADIPTAYQDKPLHTIAKTKTTKAKTTKTTQEDK